MVALGTESIKTIKISTYDLGETDERSPMTEPRGKLGIQGVVLSAIAVRNGES